MKTASAAILAGAILASAAATRAAPPADRIEIGGVVHGRILKLPPPKDPWDAKALRTRVHEYRGRAVLEVERKRPSPGDTVPTFVQQLHGVVDVEGAKAHFRLEHGIDLDKALLQEGARIRELEQRACPGGRVLVVDLGKLGWVPGNRYYYFFFDDAPRPVTVHVGPTWYVDYDLEQVRLERDPRR